MQNLTNNPRYLGNSARSAATHLLFTHMKQHTGFPSLSKAVTLNDHEPRNDRFILHYFTIFGRFGGRLRQGGRS